MALPPWRARGGRCWRSPEHGCRSIDPIRKPRSAYLTFEEQPMGAVEEEIGQFTEAKVTDEWRIGFILIRCGRLKKEDVVRIVQHQRQTGMRFGDAAKGLGMLSDSDIRFALARQFNYPFAQDGESTISPQVMAAYHPESVEVEALRALRSELMLRWFGGGDARQKGLAIVGAEDGVGRSLLAANLAVAFAQLGKRTVLVDGDLRKSSQHRIFGISNQQGLSDLLRGRAKLTKVLQGALHNLAILAAGAPPPNPQELIAGGKFEGLLDDLRATVDIVIVDTPAGTRCADGQIIAMRTGGALVMAKRSLSRVASLNAYAEALQAANATIVASVLVD
jgi:protein-tyrosine kinase